MELIEKLAKKQQEMNMSDRAFAKLLGVSQPLWSGVKHGKLPLGQKIIRSTVRQFPTLSDDVLRHYTGEVAA